MSNDFDCRERIQSLQNELDEMTLALTQAWDQLVPFLQEVPEHANTTQDIEPILRALSMAVDADITGMFLAETEQWFTISDHIILDVFTIGQIAAISTETILTLNTASGKSIQWTCTPIFSEGKSIGVLGAGTVDLERSFTAVDLRIVTRMAERIGSQLTATQLARSREREAIQAHEMNIANGIQQSVLPTDKPVHRCLEMGSFWMPAKDVGGDAWGWVQQDHKLSWFVLDVAGKGIPAALASVALHTAISMALRMDQTPAQALTAINTQLYDAYTRTDLIATVAILSVDCETHTLEIANAGHPPILLNHEGKWLDIEASVPPLGVLEDLYPERQTFELSPDDLIVCYSDGFTEIATPEGLWGQEGLRGAIQNRDGEVNTMIEHIVTSSQAAGATSDDQTLVVVRLKKEQQSDNDA